MVTFNPFTGNLDITGGSAGPLVITDTFVVNSEAEMLALTVQRGDLAVRTDLSKTFILQGDDPTVLSNWVELATPPDAVTSVNTQVGDVVLGKADVGLGNVDNTSDLDKPISTATQDALDLKYDASNPAGYITLAEVPADLVSSVNGQVGIVQLNAEDIPFTPTVDIIATDVQAAIEELSNDLIAGTTDVFQDTKEPTGYVNRTDSTMSFDDGTLTFTIAPLAPATSFEYYIKGKKVVISTTKQHTITSTAGNHFIYFDESGNLGSLTNFDPALFSEYAFTAIVYWNSETNSHTYFADERHGITMDGGTHAYLHTVFGARFISGHALQGFNVNGNGDSDPHAQFTADSGTIRDEDIIFQSSAQTQIPILYRIGTSGLWRKKAADTFPIIYTGTAGYTGTLLPYNQFTGGSWQLTELGSTKYVLVHVFATNDIENPILGIQGTTEYGSVADARLNANLEIASLSGLPLTEFVAVGSVIFQTSSAFDNTPHASITSTDTGANYVDFRGTELYTPAGEATTHGLLSGLSSDDHLQYLLVSGTRAMTGDLNMGVHKISNVVDPSAAQDASTKAYTDTADALKVAKAGDTMTGTLAINSGFGSVTEVSTGGLQTYSDVGTATEKFASVIPWQVQVYQTDNTTSSFQGSKLGIGNLNVYAETALDGVVSEIWGEANYDGTAQLYVQNYVNNNVTTIGTGQISLLTNNVASIPTLDEQVATKKYVDSKDLSSVGDIKETIFNAANNQVLPVDVTALAFSNATIGGFKVLLTINLVSATSNLRTTVELTGVQLASGWSIASSYLGDNTGIVLSIDSSGQIQYTAPNTVGWISTTMRFRAQVITK